MQNLPTPFSSAHQLLIAFLGSQVQRCYAIGRCATAAHFDEGRLRRRIQQRADYSYVSAAHGNKQWGLAPLVDSSCCKGRCIQQQTGGCQLAFENCFMQRQHARLVSQCGRCMGGQQRSNNAAVPLGCSQVQCCSALWEGDEARPV